MYRLDFIQKLENNNNNYGIFTLHMLYFITYNFSVFIIVVLAADVCLFF